MVQLLLLFVLFHSKGNKYLTIVITFHETRLGVLLTFSEKLFKDIFCLLKDEYVFNFVAFSNILIHRSQISL